MQAVRHNDLSARIEMLPLIDVIFLLLTFFIYSMVLMVP
jgi:biopolymer transport protein ExbD